MFIQTEQTPNPSTLKFLPGRVVMDKGTLDFADATTSHGSPLAKRLFAVEGVERVFPIHSPRIAKVEVEQQGRARRARLNYLRTRKGKEATAVRE